MTSDATVLLDLAELDDDVFDDEHEDVLDAILDVILFPDGDEYFDPDAEVVPDDKDGDADRVETFVAGPIVIVMIDGEPVAWLALDA